MDRFMDTLTEFDSCLPKMLLETELSASNMELFFKVIVSGKCCKKEVGILFLLKQNKLTIGRTSQFDSQIISKMEQVIFDSGMCLANTETTSLSKTFSEKRELVITSFFGKFVLVTKCEILELLGIYMKRKLDNGVLIKRRIDCNVFLALLIEKTTYGKQAESYLSNVMSIADDTFRKKEVLNAVDITNSTKETYAGQPSFKPRHTASWSLGNILSGVEQRNVYSAINSNAVTSGHSAQTHTKPPRYPDYMEQQKRQASFSAPGWSVDNKPDPFLLAEFGFFFTGEQDLVRCYQCGIGLKDWTREDDVLAEHVKHSSPCDFIVMKFGKNRIDRIKLSLTSDDNNETVSIASQQLPYKIRSPRYQTMEARIASFRDFPQYINVPAQQLAVAGLFYTGKGDLCRCFTCDGGLKDWSSGDDPIKGHATYFPNCSYIIRLKGPEYIECQQQSRQSYKPMGAPNHPMNYLPETDSIHSSFTVSQVVQKLGYSAVEVNTAKAELEMKGTKFPTPEQIVNTLLDIQERSDHFPTASVHPATKENKNENVQYKKRLIKCTSKLVEKLSPGVLLDKFFEREFLTLVETRDIRELQSTSDKNRAILQKVMTKEIYMEFKDCLRQCNQGHIAELLEREES